MVHSKPAAIRQFRRHIPTVYPRPTNFAVPGARQDYVPQQLTPASCDGEVSSGQTVKPNRGFSCGRPWQRRLNFRSAQTAAVMLRPAMAGGDGDRGDGQIPAYRRASVTGIQLALGGILMCFWRDELYIVRRGVTTDWQPVPATATAVGEYGRTAGEQRHD